MVRKGNTIQENFFRRNYLSPEGNERNEILYTVERNFKIW